MMNMAPYLPFVLLPVANRSACYLRDRTGGAPGPKEEAMPPGG